MLNSLWKFNVKLSGIAKTLKDVIAFYICKDAEISYQYLLQIQVTKS